VISRIIADLFEVAGTPLATLLNKSAGQKAHACEARHSTEMKDVYIIA
jgi:hypothetical protein